MRRRPIAYSTPARMLHAPDQGLRLMPGDIVVAASTDPSWTPLFLRAAGLVMETGGFLSHGAIVAREFGIPAALNRHGMLARLTDGDRLQVDGASETVSLIDSRISGNAARETEPALRSG